MLWTRATLWPILTQTMPTRYYDLHGSSWGLWSASVRSTSCRLGGRRRGPWSRRPPSPSSPWSSLPCWRIRRTREPASWSDSAPPQPGLHNQLAIKEIILTNRGLWRRFSGGIYCDYRLECFPFMMYFRIYGLGENSDIVCALAKQECESVQ